MPNPLGLDTSLRSYSTGAELAPSERTLLVQKHESRLLFAWKAACMV